jgi:hypothetical protein
MSGEKIFILPLEIPTKNGYDLNEVEGRKERKRRKMKSEASLRLLWECCCLAWFFLVRLPILYVVVVDVLAVH